MSSSYGRQALLLVLLAFVFFLITVVLLVTSARGQEPTPSAEEWGQWQTPGHIAQGGMPSVANSEAGGRDCWASESKSLRARRHARSIDGLWRYTRVEGLFLGLELPREYDWDGWGLPILIWSHAGYGFSSKAWRYQLGLERWFTAGKASDPAFRFTVGGELHDLTESQDEWIIPTLENSLAAMLFKEDFHDYYRRTGASGYVEQEVMGQITFRAEYRDDHFYNMPRRTNWALFGGKKNFRPNPPIDEGHFRGAAGLLTLDTRDDRCAPEEGWFLQAVAEFYGRQVRSDRKFDRFILDVRRYQPLSHAENLDLRLRLGSARGCLPEQFLFDLGGIGTLRGFRFKEFTGDRLFLGNVEYRLRAGRRDFPPFLFEQMNLILFFDIGSAWYAQDPSRPERGWKQLSLTRLKSDFGIGISDRDGRVRISFAKRTDSASAPIVVTFRINREF